MRTRYLVIAVGLAMLFAACSDSTDSTTTAADGEATTQASGTQPTDQESTSTTEGEASGGGGEFVAGKIGDFTTFDPWVVLASNAIMHHQLFNPLVFNTTPGEFNPELAESWSFSDDSSSVTFTIREGVLFHNGRELVAEDVVANIERAQDDSIGHGLSGQTTIIADATAVDEATVDVTFVSPVPQQVALDLFANMFIIAPEAMENVASEPIGTGPFILEEWLPGEEATFRAFDDYWKEGLPLVDVLTVRNFADPSAMRIAYDAGEIDLIQRAPNSDAPRYRDAEGTEVFESARAGGFWDLVINVTSPPFDDVRVRQALAHSVNREAILQNVLFGVGEPIQTPFWNEQLDIYNAEQTERYPFDLDRAAELLAEAGEEDLSFTIGVNTGSPNTIANAEVIQADLLKIGVDMQLEEMENSIWIERWLAGDFEVFSGSSAVLPRDLSATYSIVAPFKADGNSNASYTDQTYIDLAAEAAVTIDPDERTAFYSDLRDIVVEESFVVPIATNPWLYIVREEVDGLSWSAAFEYLLLEEATAGS